MSLETALARVAELRGALTPASPPPAQRTARTQQPFDAALRGAMTAGAPPGTPAPPVAPGQYPHLRGDLDASPEILSRLEALAARRGESFTVTSGHRSVEEQQRLWDDRHSNPYPVARPGNSRHQSGRAADVTIGGRAIQDVISDAELRAAGLVPLKGDAVHVELS